MARLRFLLIVSLAWLAACGAAPNVTPPPTPQVVSLGVTPATEPWLDVFYDCANAMPAVALMRVPPDAAQISVRVGAPRFVTGAAWQVGDLTLAVALNAENPLQSLDAAQIRALFRGEAADWSVLGGAARPVHAWLFPPESDVTEVFRQTWLDGAPVFPSTRWVADGEHLAQEVAADADAVGVLPLDALTPDLRAAARWDAPVLALTAANPPPLVLQILGCVQAQSQKR